MQVLCVLALNDAGRLPTATPACKVAPLDIPAFASTSQGLVRAVERALKGEPAADEQRYGPGGRRSLVAGPALADLGSRLRQLAGDAAYQAGLAYFRKGVVKDGSVAGARPTPPLQVSTDRTASASPSARSGDVAQGAGTVKVTCTCPAHRRNRYCKHVVAVCTALLQAPSSSSSVPPLPELQRAKAPAPAPPAPRRTARATRAQGDAQRPAPRSRRYAPPGWRRSSAR